MAKKPKQERTEQILEVAMDIAINQGFHKLRRDDIAERAGVATGQINHVFNTMCQLRRSVVRRTISTLDKCAEGEYDLSLLRVLGAALTDENAEVKNAAKKAPEEMRRAAIDLYL